MTRLKILLQSKILYCSLILLILIYVFICNMFIKDTSLYALGKNSIIGRVENIRVNSDYISFTLVAKEKLQVQFYSCDIAINEGSIVKVTGTLKRVLNYTIPNTFNYKNYLYSKRIKGILSANSIELVRDEGVIYKIRNSIQKRIEQDALSSSYLKLFILGNKGDFNSEIYTTFKKNGIAHLFAISGMHITFFVNVLELILKRINPRVRTLLMLFILWFYSFITGFSVSILRCLVFLL